MCWNVHENFPKEKWEFDNHSSTAGFNIKQKHHSCCTSSTCSSAALPWNRGTADKCQWCDGHSNSIDRSSGLQVWFPHCATSKRSKTTKPKPGKNFPAEERIELCSLYFTGICDIWKKTGQIETPKNGWHSTRRQCCLPSLFLHVFDHPWSNYFRFEHLWTCHRPKLCLLPGTQSFGFRVVNESHVLTQANLQTSPAHDQSMVTLFPTGDPKD